ncbi:hypothetical protein I4U23_022759 [Adineta vaga]|nr:hypothetical protein I4U23_022759 [Adineta vaga]
MTTATVIPNMSTSFVYEDLVSHVKNLQNEIIQMENILWNRYETDKNVQSEIKSRSFTFIDPYGNRTIKKFMDHELIEKVLKKYKKDYVPKYLREWIKIGTMKDNAISALNECELESTVSKFDHGSIFITYAEVIVWIRNYEDFWIKIMPLKVLLSDDMNKIKIKIKEERNFSDIELKSCEIDQNRKSMAKNWLQGKTLKSEDTILSSELYQNNWIIMAKITRIQNNDTQSNNNGLNGHLLYLVPNMTGGMYHFTSGRQDFSLLPDKAAITVQNVLKFKFLHSNRFQQLSSSQLQNSILAAQTILSTLHRELQYFSSEDNIPNVKSIVLQTLIDNQESSESEEDN